MHEDILLIKKYFPVLQLEGLHFINNLPSSFLPSFFPPLPPRCLYMYISQGFHRYSTDKFWHVPHFEKMLYDQGQLATVYLTAYQVPTPPGSSRPSWYNKTIKSSM